MQKLDKHKSHMHVQPGTTATDEICDVTDVVAHATDQPSGRTACPRQPRPSMLHSACVHGEHLTKASVPGGCFDNKYARLMAQWQDAAMHVVAVASGPAALPKQLLITCNASNNPSQESWHPLRQTVTHRGPRWILGVAASSYVRTRTVL